MKVEEPACIPKTECYAEFEHTRGMTFRVWFKEGVLLRMDAGNSRTFHIKTEGDTLWFYHTPQRCWKTFKGVTSDEFNARINDAYQNYVIEQAINNE